MVDIAHRIGIAAPPAEVYRSLSTLEGLGTWWTRTLSGDPDPGGRLSFFFGNPEPGAVMEVVESTIDQRVTWRCVEGPDEWLDTTVVFELAEVDGETVVRFAHAGWREPVEFMSHCCTKWGLFLLGLKAGHEGGKATPFPGEVKISSWG
jgi:uncharacterized protein YndB with AHSA1/START domain